MIESVKNYVKNNKLKVLVITVPLIVLGLFSILSPGLRTWLFERVKKKIAEANEKDSQLIKEQEEAKLKAKEHLAKANSLAGQKENLDDDADWHKKVK